MLKKTIAALVPSLMIASGAQAGFIAGWDFGQYIGPGAASLDGVNLATQVDANYSDFDPTFGAGAESAAYGTLFLDGTAGSTAGGGGIIVPTADAISLLQALPQNGDPTPDVAFDAASVQNAEFPGRFAPHQDVSMIATGIVDIVFQADLGVGGSADSFSLELAGLALGSPGVVEVAYSTDGTSYTPAASLNLGATEQAYLVDFAGTALDGASSAFVRLSLGTANLVIDNVGISGVNATVPEPNAALLMVVGLMGLARAGRARK